MRECLLNCRMHEDVENGKSGWKNGLNLSHEVNRLSSRTLEGSSCGRRNSMFRMCGVYLHKLEYLEDKISALFYRT